MKKHIIGFTIFTFIVGSFAVVWALFGFFTQTIPNVPKVESDNLPVFKSEHRRSCRRNREKISYDVVDSYYFADTKKVVSTLRLRWNGYGEPPENFVVTPKIFTADNQVLTAYKPQHLRSMPNLVKPEFYLDVNLDISLSDSDLAENMYENFIISSEDGEILSSNNNLQAHPIVVVHGESSIINR